MECDQNKSDSTSFSPLKRYLSSQDPLKPNKKNRISLSLSKSRKNKDLESITNTLNSLTTAFPNSSQQHSQEIKNERKESVCVKQQTQSIKEEEKLLSLPPLTQLPQLKIEDSKGIKKVEEKYACSVIKNIEEGYVIKKEGEELASLSLPLSIPSSSASISKVEEEEKKLEEYACPICNKDLTLTKSSYLRQNHVEACISSSASTAKEETLEFDDCIFCAKSLSRFNQKQRQVHLNNCLDQVQSAEKEKEASSFAGQHVPFLQTLEICPVCHEVTPFLNKTIKQKIQHAKQCAKQNKLSLVDLLKKFQWIGWGHLPVAVPNDTPSSSAAYIPPAPTPIQISHKYVVTNLQDDDMEEKDNDFDEKVIIHKTNQKLIPKPTRKEDNDDEELQTVLALSRSMVKTKEKKRQGIKRTDERDWNAANIWSMEESRKEANIKLDELLFSEEGVNELYKQSERERSIGYLKESRLFSCIIPKRISYWNLASNLDSNWDDPFIFVSLFLRK